MIKRIFILILIVSCSNKNRKPSVIEPIMAIDEYHGKQIKDPYRNLENLKDTTVVDWLKKQGKYASDLLKRIPNRQQLIDKQQSYDIKKEFSFFHSKTTADGKYFYTKTIGEEQIAKLYYRTSLNSEEILLYDPTLYSKKQEYSINYIKPDWVGDKIVISLSKKGEEASEMIIMEVATKKILPGVIKKCLPDIGGIQWLSDNSGFIYLYSPIIDPTNKDYWTNTQSILYTIGNTSKKLKDIFSIKNNPELNLKPADFPIINNHRVKDGYLFGVVGGVSSFYDTYYKSESEFDSNDKSWKLLFKESDKIKKYIVDNNNNLIFLSAKNAPNFQICKTSMNNPDFNNPEILVPEKKDLLITQFEITKDGLFFTTKKNGVESKLYYLEDEEREIILPKSAGDIYIGSKGPDNELLRVIVTGYLNPQTNYLYNVKDNSFKLEIFTPNVEYPDFENLVVDHVEVPSHDGVLIPVSIIKHKGIKKNGNNPTLFYGYGSYGGSGGVFFSPSFLSWTTTGGILVISHVRGGGQKGVEWHKAGQKTTKPNTWKDMIATTEYMIKEGYTSPEKSAIWGSSAGGILAGRAMTERPDLYKAVILTSPAMNMLRSEIQPNGQNSIKEFGTVKIKEEFEALLEMDSYHHIKEGVEYPATLVTGGMKDGRVVIWDPAKFVARLQASNAADTPVLFQVKFEDGHAAMNSTKIDRYEMYANVFSFALWQMGYPEYQPK
ncbi:prolyl oligopeptidase family serine peptidase [Aquimarina sp. RZ0]|uniref:prolyl oligopeptidase family serine peptidase n=1 Tax=Aquimarina sp. RZ0 TaxID=2607730 RepID=UPI00165EFD93|nr:prolyl oligopeptidase family serine peptidase [Aquimarina sp. RZ0]